MDFEKLAAKLHPVHSILRQDISKVSRPVSWVTQDQIPFLHPICANQSWYVILIQYSVQTAPDTRWSWPCSKSSRLGWPPTPSLRSRQVGPRYSITKTLHIIFCQWTRDHRHRERIPTWMLPAALWSLDTLAAGHGPFACRLHWPSPR